MPLTADRRRSSIRSAGADHLDQPVDSNTVAPDRQVTAVSQGQWHGPEIDVNGEPAVKVRLCFGIALPGLASREVEAIPAQSFFQFVDVQASQKTQGEVRLDCFDARRFILVGPQRLEKCRLAGGMNSRRCLLPSSRMC